MDPLYIKSHYQLWSMYISYGVDFSRISVLPKRSRQYFENYCSSGSEGFQKYPQTPSLRLTSRILSEFCLVGTKPAKTLILRKRISGVYTTTIILLVSMYEKTCQDVYCPFGKFDLKLTSTYRVQFECAMQQHRSICIKYLMLNVKEILISIINAEKMLFLS